MNITPFSFDQHPVRVIDRDGQTWFVAEDVAEALEYQAAKDMCRNLDEDERGRQIVPIPSGNQEMLIINESGLYSAILRSRKASARRFKKWVTSEVLPAIRKTGEYADKAQPERKGKQKALPGCVSIEQQEAIRELVKAKTEALPPEKRGVAMIKLWSALKAHFGVGYKEIAHERFSDALSLVARQALAGELLPASAPTPQLSPEPKRYTYDAEWMMRFNGPRLRPLNEYDQLILNANETLTLMRPPLDELLRELAADGSDVSAAAAEYHALNHHLRRLYGALREQMSALSNMQEAARQASVAERAFSVWAPHLTAGQRCS